VATVTYTAVPCVDVRAEHAEGPTWDAVREELLWVDILGHRVHRARARHRGTATWLEPVAAHDTGQCVTAIAPFADPADGWIVACERGFGHLDAGGTLRVLDEPEAAAAGRTRMNDGKCDPSGRFWAGSMAWDVTPDAGRLYRMGLDGRVDVVLPAVTVSNGLCWTAEGHTMYYVDTPTRRVECFELDPATGDVLDRQVAFEVDPDDGWPDGMTIDDEGCLWVALWGGGQVVRYTTDGRVLARVRVDARQASSCAFGGPKRRTLFITTSQEGLDAAERARQPDAGRVFCADVDVAGPPAAPCRVRPSLRESTNDNRRSLTARSIEEESVP
jgi:sugar lactone lactonase YvrE